ncbi:MAG: hypothetical protein P8Y44_00370 [Acidobacteriota bacterium]
MPFERFELAVYWIPREARATDRDLESRAPVWTVTVPGAGRSWTPSVDRCLADEGLYVWSLRGITTEGATEWSSGSRFVIAQDRIPERAAIADLLLRSLEPAGGSATPLAQSPPALAVSAGVEASADEGALSPPALKVQGAMMVGDYTSFFDGEFLGAIASDTTFDSRADGYLQASRFRLYLDPGGAGVDMTVSDMQGDERFQLNLPGFGGDCRFNAGCADLEVGRLITDNLEVRGRFDFIGETGWLGSGGAGYFEVPSATNARVDNNPSSCGGRPVLSVALSETDADQIGIIVLCGE